jgi:hypothetical protein
VSEIGTWLTAAAANAATMRRVKALMTEKALLLERMTSSGDASKLL